jgi:NTP pyrophosphatase (non-canonical NTP hydrolase)
MGIIMVNIDVDENNVYVENQYYHSFTNNENLVLMLQAVIEKCLYSGESILLSSQNKPIQEWINPHVSDRYRQILTLDKLQFELRKWQQHNFPNRERWEPLMGVAEEVGELSHAHLKKHQGIRLEEDHDATAQDAIGDIVIYLADYCNARGFNLGEIVTDTWELVKQRDWRRDNASTE